MMLIIQSGIWQFKPHSTNIDVQIVLEARRSRMDGNEKEEFGVQIGFCCGKDADLGLRSGARIAYRMS